MTSTHLIVVEIEFLNIRGQFLLRDLHFSQNYRKYAENGVTVPCIQQCSLTGDSP
jgi:hypothetical protein